VHWCVVLGPWSFVFNGLDRILVSFPIEKFPDAKTLGGRLVFFFSLWLTFGVRSVRSCSTYCKIRGIPPDTLRTLTLYGCPECPESTVGSELQD